MTTIAPTDPPAPASVLATAYAHGPGKQVTAAPRTPRPPTGAAPGPDLGELAAAGPFAAAVVRTLLAALAPLRWDDWSTHREHRAVPSPRSAYLHDVALRTGSGCWSVDPVRRCLGGPGRPVLDHVPGGPIGPDGPVCLLEVRVAPDRLPPTYGGLRSALALLEAGHVLAALATAAGEAGLRADVEVTPDLDAAEPRGVIGTVRLTPGPAGRRRNGPARPATRCSGVGPRGLSADPRPLPPAHLDALLAGVASSPWRGAALDHRLAVQGVRDRADGWYDPGPDGPRLIRRGAATDAVAAASRTGPADLDVAGMNVVWGMSTDVPAAVRTDGPGAYARLLVCAGMTAQYVATAAAAVGMFCRPIRSIDEGVAEAAFLLLPQQDLLYVLLLGRPRVTDFPYDLTPVHPTVRTEPEDSP